MLKGIGVTIFSLGFVGMILAGMGLGLLMISSMYQIQLIILSQIPIVYYGAGVILSAIFMVYGMEMRHPDKA